MTADNTGIDNHERTIYVMNRSFSKVIAAFCISSAMACSSFYYTPVTAFSPDMAEQSISDLEQMKEDNNQKIAELQAEIDQAKEKYDEVVMDEQSKLEYKNALTEKMELQNQNIDFVAGQIEKLDIEIGSNVDKINSIESKIKTTDEKIDNNLSLLKQRLRASYMASGDNISSILSGSSSFYDMLAKFELIAKVAEHDDALIKGLQEQIDDLKLLKQSLQNQQDILEENLASEKEKKDEYTEALEELGVNYMETQAELNRINGVKDEIISSIEEREEAMAEQEEELKKIAEEMEEIQQMLIQFSISESVSISESESVAASVAQSVAESRAEEISRLAEESKRAEESRRIEESKRAEEESRRAEQNAAAGRETEPPKKEEPASSQAPVTEAPAPEEPVTPSVETQAPPPPVSSSSGFGWPMANGYGTITSEWGSRWGTFHKGVDITASDGGTIMGKPIVAAASGIVVTAPNTCTHNYGKSSSCGCGGGYGRYVVIAHSDGKYSTLYAHMSSVSVSPKQYVSKGDIIGYAGSTGYSTGPHLHFEVHKSTSMDSQFWNKDNTVDPRNFI